VSTELQFLLWWQLQHFLQVLPDLHEHILRLALPALALANRSCPETYAVEALAHIDHYTHDLVVTIIFECLTDGCELCVEPERVDVDGLLVAPAVGPFSAVLVLCILPFRADALLEEVVVGFLSEVGAGGDVVLVEMLGRSWG
jgi:hypothetical protein